MTRRRARTRLMGCTLAAAAVVAQRAAPATAQAPEVFAPGVVSTAAIEYAAAFTAWGDTVYFTRRASFREPARLWMAWRRTDGTWVDGGPLALSSGQGDEYPAVSPDGSRLYFASRRPLPGDTAAPRENALWVSRRTASGWGTPEPVVIPGWAGLMASHPFEAADGSLYFHSRRPDGAGRVDAYRAPREGAHFGAPALLPINSPAVDGEVVVSPGLDRLVFYSEREGGLGRGDLYVSFADAGAWLAPTNLGVPVNSAAFEWTPSLSPDGRRLYFARLDEGFTRSDLFVIDISLVPALRAR